MVTGGGLDGSANIWVSRVYYDRDALMEAWRKAVVALLRVALRAGPLRTEMTVDQTEEMLSEQEKRWWSVKVQNFKSKEHFLKYAGRYLRRPPIARHYAQVEFIERDIGVRRLLMQSRGDQALSQGMQRLEKPRKP